MSRLRAHTREALAFARQASLIHLDFGAVLPTETNAGDHVVVLLHGLFATAGVLRPLRKRIESETGAHTASFSYLPGPGVNRLAVDLASLVERLPRDAHLHLVGHSLGGVVARYFVQELGGDPRVRQTVSLGSPFGGTEHARLMPSGAGRDISPGSPVLQRVVSAAHRHQHVPHLSISGADDQVVTGFSHLPGSDHVELSDCGHNGLLYDVRAADLVVERIQQAIGAAEQQNPAA
ncbi:MAG: hypothetical protein R3B89_01700 [Polyangiaceae bacterium]